MTNEEKYHYGLDRALILDKSLNPITSFNCGDNILCPTFFGYVWCKITNENTLYAESEKCFYVIEKKDDMYKLAFYGDKSIYETPI